MFKVGDREYRVKLTDNNGYRLRVGTTTAGTITTGSCMSGRKAAEVYFDNGQCLTITEGKTKQDESAALKYQKHLRAIYESAMFTDFTIICKSEEEEYKFQCHKAVIATGSASGHFARMFGSGMTESSSGEVDVQGYDKEEIEHFIKFLYVLEMEEGVLEKHSVKFLKMADQYDVPMLKADVTNFLLSRLTKDTVLSIIIAAHSYNAPDLKSAAIEFIVKNKLEQKSLDEWKLALKGHEDLLLDIFSVVFKK